MRDLVSKELDRVDELGVGAGRLDLFGFMRGDLHSGMLGGALEYGHRVTPRASLFARAEAGYRYGEGRGFAYSGLFGGRVTF